MKKVIITLVLLATVSSLQAATNPVTGMPYGTAWARFESEIGKHPAKLERFVAGLQLAEIGITPASGVGEFMADATSAKLATALSNETGTGVVVFNTTPTLVTPVLGAATGTSLALGTDPADAGVIRLENAAVIGWEADAAGTDVTLTVNSSEQFVFSAAILSPTFVTPTLGVASATSLATSAASPLLLTNGQLVTIALTSQTVGGATLTIPDFASVADEFTFKTKAQTMANKTLTAPVIAGGLTASGSSANTFASSTGTFITSSGLNTLSGKVAFKTIDTPVAAAGAGGGVAAAAQLGSANVVTISSDGATKGVKLVTGVPGDVVYVINTSSTAANLFAASGGTVNGGAADAGCAVPASKGVIAICIAADTWIVIDMTARAGAAA